MITATKKTSAQALADGETTVGVVATRASKRAAEAYIASFADCIGETTRWNGQRAVPVTLTWEPVRNAETGRWDIVSTCTPREV